MQNEKQKLELASLNDGAEVARWREVTEAEVAKEVMTLVAKEERRQGVAGRDDEAGAKVARLQGLIKDMIGDTLLMQYVNTSKDRDEAGLIARWRGRKAVDLPLAVPRAADADTSLGRQAKAVAKVIVEELLDTLARTWLGMSAKELEERSRTRAQRLVLRTKISIGEPAEVRSAVFRFLLLHAELVNNDLLAIEDLHEQLDPRMAKLMPGVQESLQLLEKTKKGEKADVGAAKLASRAEDVAAKLYEAPSKSKVAAAPTAELQGELTETREPWQQEREERSSRSRQRGLICFACHKEGHYMKDCRQRKAASKTVRADSKVCEACGLSGHFARRCPTQTCQECGEKGHRRQDCPKGNKNALSNCSSDEGEKDTAAGATEETLTTTAGASESVPAAAVLLVEGQLDGKEARVGLDSFAGAGMVTAEAVKERRSEWEQTDVRLQGVAANAVKPLGVVDVHVKVGEVKFTEKAMVCEHLPGRADLLVSYDTLREKGLQVSKQGVTLGGQKCTVVAAAAPLKKPADGQRAEEQQRANERAARKMLRQKDAAFAGLEAKGKIEKVQLAPNGECDGYTIRAERLANEKPTELRNQDKESKTKKGPSKRLRKEAKEAKKRRKRARKALEERDWKRMEPELMRCQAEARKVIAAVEKQEWQKEEAATVVEVAAAAASCKAAEVIEKNKWQKADIMAALETEEEVPEAVELDEFCVPEVKTAAERAEFMKDFEEKARKLQENSALRSTKAKVEYVKVMLKHANAYCRSLDDFRPGQLSVPELQLNFVGKPVQEPRRQMSMEDEEWFRKETVKFDKMGLWSAPSKQMEDEGLCVSNAVVVKKTDKASGELKRRLTVDFRGPNSRISPPPQRIPTVSELSERTGKAVLFDKDDGISGYYQWKLHESSKRFTGVYTPLGVRVFNCMPLGINVAPSVWNGAMAAKFGDMPGDRVFTLMDDFVRYTPAAEGATREETEMEHIRLLDEFLTRVEAMNLKLKLDKAEHAVETVEALGMRYGQGKVEKTEWTTSVIQDYPAPRSSKQMERFLALGQYYGGFVEEYARLVAPLRKLQRKRRWGPSDLAEGSEERKLFDHVKAELAKRVRLALPNWSKEFFTKSDFSKEAIGGALLQKDDSGKLRAVGFVSRKCTPAEGKLSAADGEMVALVWTLQRFEKFLLGRKFTAYVDQGSLSWLKDRALGSINNKRLQHSFAYLRQFKFDLLYLKSEKMKDVDALSRIQTVEAGALAATRETTTIEVWSEEEEVAVGGVAQVDLEGYWGFDTELRDAGELQQVDDEVLAIRELRRGRKWEDVQTTPAARDAINKYMSQDPTCDNFVEGADGRLYHLETKNGEVVRQLYVPVAMRGRLVVSKHGSAVGGHRAAEETLAKLRKRYYWASIRRDVEQWIGACGCQQKKGERKQKVGEMASMKIARPGEKIVFDIFGPLPASLKGNVYLLVMMDVGTREMMLEALPTRAAAGVARAIYRRVYLSGRSPRVFQSDLAKEFVANVVKELIVQLGAKFRHSSPYHPQTNTHVERYNKTLATNLSLLLQRKDQKDWDEYLGEVEYAQLVGAQKVLAGFSPLFLRGGWDALDPIDRAMGTAESVAGKVEVADWMNRIKRARQIAMQNQELAAARDAKNYNLKAKQLKVEEGDEVWVMFPNVGAGRSRKLAFRLHGPYKLVSWLGEKKRTARLAHKGDERDVITAHVDRIVKKNVLPERLVEAWKPLKLGNAEYAREEVERVEGEEEREQRENELAERIDRDLDSQVAEEVERKLVDQDDPDDGHFIEKILEHRDEDDAGGREYKVRFVGYGPDKDLWFMDEHLLDSAPEMVAEYEEEREKEALEKIGRRGRGKRVPGKSKGGGRKRVEG